MIALVVQARMGSTRCPGKVLADVQGRPMLARMLERLSFVSAPCQVVLATTASEADAPIARLGEELGVRTFLGHPTDLLDRHLGAARSVSATAVAKVPSDCPLVDPRVVDRVLFAYLEEEGQVDYVGNLHPATWPDGNDVEVMPLHALELAHREAKKPHEREHTTPFFWDQPGRFRLRSVINPTSGAGKDLAMSHRFTVDYPEDLTFVRAVFGALLPTKGPNFSVEDVLALLEARPDILASNARYAGVNWYRLHLADLRTVDEKDTRWPQEN